MNEANKTTKSVDLSLKKTLLIIVALIIAMPILLIAALYLYGGGVILLDKIRGTNKVNGEYRFECPDVPEVIGQKINFREDKVVEMGNYQLVYPFGYGVGFDMPMYRENGRVNDQMQLVYPSLLPTRAPAIAKRDIGVNRIYISIAYYPDGKRHFQNSIALLDPKRIAPPEAVPDLGLMAYFDPTRYRDFERHMDYRRVLKYVPMEPFDIVPGHPYVLECPSGARAYPGPAHGTCYVVFPLRDTIWVRYSVFSERLPCWRQIHEGVFRLTDSFIKENTKGTL